MRPYTFTEHGDLVDNAVISNDASIGLGTIIYSYTTIEENVTIGPNCVVGSNVFIGAGTRIEEGTRIQHGAFICRNAKIGKNVFIGPLAILTDDKYPVAGHTGYKQEPPTLEDGCSVGAGAIILPGIIIGANAMVGAGAVVTHNVGIKQTVVKVPAVLVGGCQSGGPNVKIDKLPHLDADWEGKEVDKEIWTDKYHD